MSRSRALFEHEEIPLQTKARAAKRQRANTTASESSAYSAASSRALNIAPLAEKGELQYKGNTSLKSACKVQNHDEHHVNCQVISPASKQHLMESLATEPSSAYLKEVDAGLVSQVVADCPKRQRLPLVVEEAAQSCAVGNPIHKIWLVDYDVVDSISSSDDSDHDFRHNRLIENMDRNISPKLSLPVPGPSGIYDDECETDFNLIRARIPTVAEREIPSDDVLDTDDRQFIETLQEKLDNELDHLLGFNTNFNWTEDFTTFKGVPEEFTGGNTGPTRPLLTPYEAFSAIWDEAIVSVIVNETNRYAHNIITENTENGTHTACARMRKWVDVTADEIMTLFSVYMLMGLYPLGRLDMYWQCNGPVKVVGFKEIMTFQRYVLLTKCLQFVDNSKIGSTDRKLFKLRPIIDHLNNKFQELYVMEGVISLDESLSLWKGFLSWVQMIRTKAARFGIKTFEVCEASIGYLWKFEVYTGKTDGGSEVSLNDALSGKSCKIVLELLKGLEHKGYCVVMDNFYNCPALARYLKSQGFDCLGTVRANRKHMPEAVKALKESVPKGTIVSRHSGDVSVVSWKDAKLVNIISTFHDSSTYVGQRAGKALVKPLVVKDYNKGMGGVDLKDQKLSMYSLERKRGAKWYTKMFKRVFNVSIHNSYILYKASVEKIGQRPLTHRQFREVLAADLVARFCKKTPTMTRSTQVTTEMRFRKDIDHYPFKVVKRARCVRCLALGKRKEVTLICETCKVHLCPGPCYRDYHNMKNLKSNTA